MKTDRTQNLRDHSLALGTFLTLGSPLVAELAVESGLDWLLLDLEHGLAGEQSILPQLLATRGSATAAVVRVGAVDPALILRLLDAGADGIMAPRISDAAAAESLVRCVRFPPTGLRGYSRSARSHGYGLREDPGPDPLVMAQIETLEGVENAGTIAAVNGVDVLFVGPADLNFAIRAHPGPGRPDFQECLRIVARAAAACAKRCGILLRDIGELEDMRALGYSVFALDSDLGILRSRFLEMKRLKDGI